MNPLVVLAEAVRSEMRRQKLSASEVARRACISQPTLSRVLARKQDPALTAVLRICGAVGIDLVNLHTLGMQPPPLVRACRECGCESADAAPRCDVCGSRKLQLRCG